MTVRRRALQLFAFLAVLFAPGVAVLVPDSRAPPIPSGEWQVFGKTGAGFPRHADGSLDRAHGYGWFVGWAERDGQAVVFARLEQEQSAQPGSAGRRARDALLQDWAQIIAQIRD